MIWKNTIPGVVDSTASRFNETSTYKKSDYVWYVAAGSSPKLYKAKEDISAGAFDASKWEEIVVTNEFVTKDLVHSEHKNIKEDFEGNKFGYRKYENWYEVRPESDSTAAYNKGDVVYARAPWDNAFRTFICIQDGPVPRQDVLDDGEPALHWDWDNNTVEANENLVPVENEIYACEDDNWHLDFYKYSGGTYTKLEPMAKNIAALKAAGFNSGDWFVSNDGEDIRIFKFLTDNPGYEFVEADIFDVAVCQDEVAKKLEDIDPSDYYYGMPFYKGYQLYALLATTPVYENVACEGSIDHDEFNIVHFGNVYAAKLDSINDMHKLFDGNSYVATQALIFNIWDSRFGLPVPGINHVNNQWHQINIVGTPMTDDSSFHDNAPSMTILARQGMKYNVKWDLKGGTYTFIIDGFSNWPGGGEEPPQVNVNYLDVYDGEFDIQDHTKNPDSEDYEIFNYYGALGFTMVFHNCRYNVYCSNKKGVFMPPEYEFYDSVASFGSDAGDYVLDFGGHSTGQTFTIVNSLLHVSADNSVEFESCNLSGINSRFNITSNKLIFNDPIYISELENSKVRISAYENMVVPGDSGYEGFLYVGGRVVNNIIEVMTKWNTTLKNKRFLYSQEDTAKYGIFDNVFEFRDSEAPALTECPFAFDPSSHFLIHAGNKMYVNKHGRDYMIWHDYPSEGGTDFHAEFIRALNKLTTQLGLTYTAIQDASGDYQYTFNLNN